MAYTIFKDMWNWLKYLNFVKYFAEIFVRYDIGKT